MDFFVSLGLGVCVCCSTIKSVVCLLLLHCSTAWSMTDKYSCEMTTTQSQSIKIWNNQNLVADRTNMEESRIETKKALSLSPHFNQCTERLNCLPLHMAFIVLIHISHNEIYDILMFPHAYHCVVFIGVALFIAVATIVYAYFFVFFSSSLCLFLFFHCLWANVVVQVKCLIWHPQECSTSCVCVYENGVIKSQAQNERTKIMCKEWRDDGKGDEEKPKE